VNKLGEYERQLFDFLDKKHPEILKEIVSSGKIDDALKARLESVLREFDTVFSA
jgi:F-type H+-transporting ATPase subunit alpha